jgi:hypothetical protein
MSALTAEEALKWLEGTLAEFPDRLAYENVCRSMLWMTTNIVREEREAFVGALKLTIQRPTVPWLALDLAVHHRLIELRPDLEAAADAMGRGDRYPAYYREFVPPFRKKLEKL